MVKKSPQAIGGIFEAVDGLYGLEHFTFKIEHLTKMHVEKCINNHINKIHRKYEQRKYNENNQYICVRRF